MFVQYSVRGDPNLGMYGFATNSYAVFGMKIKREEEIKKVLRVPLYTVPVLHSGLTGLFLAGNAQGIVASTTVKQYEPIEAGRKSVCYLDGNYTALGNLILMNDKGIIVSPMLRKQAAKLENFFGIPCKVATIATQKTVGSLGIANNLGCLVHPKVRPEEQEIIEKTLGVPVMGGTTSYGSFYPRIGLMANDHGVVASQATTGHELGFVLEALHIPYDKKEGSSSGQRIEEESEEWKFSRQKHPSRKRS